MIQENNNILYLLKWIHKIDVERKGSHDLGDEERAYCNCIHIFWNQNIMFDYLVWKRVDENRIKYFA